MSRIRLIQLPVPPPAAFADTGNVPLAAGSLAVAAEVHGLTENGLEVEVVSPDLTDALGDTLLADYTARDEPEFVGLSLYLWNVERSLHIAREIKQRSPATTILIGGPEVAAGQGFVLEATGYDIAVAGEAEDRFAALMTKLLAGADPHGMDGVAVRRPDGSMSGFGDEPVPNFPLDTYPSPYLTDAMAVDPQRSTYVETVRGCASKCAYCFYPRSSTNLRSLDHERTRELIRSLHEQGARDVSFLDPTFNHRSDLDALLDLLAAENPDRQLRFFGEVRPEGLTAAHAKALAACGFTKLELGLQSVNVETLKRVQRYGNPDRVAEAAKMLRGEGIDLFIDLIIGLPGDGPDDVARGVDFILEHDLAAFAQVFPLSVLPGTAMRHRAEDFGITYDSAPPYRVIRTATFEPDDLTEVLFAAEDALDRRLDESPRLHLVAADPSEEPRSVFEFDLDEGSSTDSAPGARHSAFWYRGSDLFAHRAAIRRHLDAHLAREPYSVLDVVLCPTSPFPLDLLEDLHAWLDAATPSYQSRALAHRGENLLRRVGVVLGRNVEVAADWVSALLEAVPVYRDQTLGLALPTLSELGRTQPCARILDDGCDDGEWLRLRGVADPEVIAFANPVLERRWQQEMTAR